MVLEDVEWLKRKREEEIMIKGREGEKRKEGLTLPPWGPLCHSTKAGVGTTAPFSMVTSEALGGDGRPRVSGCARAPLHGAPSTSHEGEAACQPGARWPASQQPR